MTGLYIASTTPGAGKTLFSFALGVLLQRQGLSVGLMKPLGATPVRLEYRTADADAMLVREIMSLADDPALLSPVFLPETLPGLMMQRWEDTPINIVASAYEILSCERDLTLVMGTRGVWGTGRAIGLTGLSVIRRLGLKVVCVERYHGDPCHDGLLSLQDELGPDLIGVVLNDVPEQHLRETENMLVPYLTGQGLPILGVIPRVSKLAAARIIDIARGINGRVLCEDGQSQRVVEDFVIGAMQVDNFLLQLNLHPNSAVIVGGDRTDLQLTALYANCSCLVLTGNLHPNELVLNKARALKIPIILAKETSYFVARQIELLLKSQKIRQLDQVKLGVDLIAGGLDLPLLRSKLGI